MDIDFNRLDELRAELQEAGFPIRYDIYVYSRSGDGEYRIAEFFIYTAIETAILYFYEPNSRKAHLKPEFEEVKKIVRKYEV